MKKVTSRTADTHSCVVFESPVLLIFHIEKSRLRECGGLQAMLEAGETLPCPHVGNKLFALVFEFKFEGS